jgi:predicted nucleic acid-binding protein
MGLLNSLQGDRIYLDVNIWIYALEGYPNFRSDLAALFQAIDQGRLTAVTSELALAEALVKPLQDQNQAVQQLYQQAIANRPNVEVISIDRSIDSHHRCTAPGHHKT